MCQVLNRNKLLERIWVQTKGKIGDKCRQAVVVLPILAKEAKNDLIQGIFDSIDFFDK